MHGCKSHSMRCASSQSLPKSQCQSTKPIHPHDNLSSFTIKAKSSTNHAFVEKEKEKKKKNKFSNYQSPYRTRIFFIPFLKTQKKMENENTTNFYPRHEYSIKPALSTIHHDHNKHDTKTIISECSSQ